MKTAAKTANEAAADLAKDCPRCNGAAGLIVPLKTVAKDMAVYGCKACGFTFHEDGRAFVESPSHLRDIFRGATKGHQTLVEMLQGEKVNPATKGLLLAKVTEYGLQMWYDGVKQGILMGLISGDHERKQEDGKVRSD